MNDRPRTPLTQHSLEAGGRLSFSIEGHAQGPAPRVDDPLAHYGQFEALAKQISAVLARAYEDMTGPHIIVDPDDPAYDLAIIATAITPSPDTPGFLAAVLETVHPLPEYMLSRLALAAATAATYMVVTECSAATALILNLI